MRIGFTGTQSGMSERQKVALTNLLVALECTELHHGDCIGADSEAHDIARELGIKIILHPPEDSKKRAFCIGYMRQISRKPYLERNHCIVDMTDMLIAGPSSNVEQLRSGTWATVRYARKLGREVRILNR